MSASTQFSQLDMWKPAHELLHGVTPGDADAGTDVSKMWNVRRAHNAMGSLLKTEDHVSPESVAREGVKVPVVVYHPDGGKPVLQDGHHRAVAAYDHNPKTLVPVEHEWPGTSIASDMIHGLFEAANKPQPRNA